MLFGGKYRPNVSGKRKNDDDVQLRLAEAAAACIDKPSALGAILDACGGMVEWQTRVP